jgi:HK97 family phage portal protein
MAIVQTTAGQLEATLQPTWTPSLFTNLHLYDRYNYDYATLYRTQPNVRTCVDFLARNVAQLGLHVFRRVSETDRQRLRASDHGLAQVLGRPLPAEFKVTTYRLIESTMADLGIYFNCLWLKVRADGAPLGLLRIPWPLVTVQGNLVPTGYVVNLNGVPKTYPPAEVVHFRGYNADLATAGLSPLETLRRVLAEEHAMAEYREYFWQNAARVGGIIERPAAAPTWSDKARERFKAEFEQLQAGGPNSGRTAVLEEGMTWQEASFDAQESEYIGSRKLGRAECARSYHIPLPMVGILDNATFSNIKEQHRNLYQDCLGPWLVLFEQDIELQLLPEFPDSEGVYCEFNIAAKLAGSFEEQTTALQSSVGRPWMTADEARARMNLPSMGGDAAQLVTPLNVLVGGQASPQDSAPDAYAAAAAPPAAKARRRLNSHHPELAAAHRKKWQQVLTRHFRRQEAAILSRLPKAAKDDLGQGVWWDGERWNAELQGDLLKLNRATALAFARLMAEDLDAEVSEEWMDPWLVEHSRIAAESINGQTRADIIKALNDPEQLEAVKHIFEIALTVRALQLAWDAVTGAANFGSHEGARAGGLKTKTWCVNSGNPRPEHAAMDGETVDIRDNFSNGMKWPGDPAGGAENNAGCECSVEFGR